MLDGLGQIEARMQQIQGRIASLSEPASLPPMIAPSAPTPPAATPTFAQTLQNAQKPVFLAAPPVTVPEHPAGGRASDTYVTPAALGPLPSTTLPPLPVLKAQAVSGAYSELINTYAAKYGLSPALVKGVIKTESDGNPKCVSSAGAMGLMQLMPENVQEAGISDPFDPAQNIAAGTKQLSDLLNQYHGDLDLALAGYNAGPGNVRKYGGVPPFPETQHYIKKVRAAMDKE